MGQVCGAHPPPQRWVKGSPHPPCGLGVGGSIMFVANSYSGIVMSLVGCSLGLSKPFLIF